MFSTKQKQEISSAIQEILKATKHPELPEGEVSFLLHVQGGEDWSWADIQNNGSYDGKPGNPFQRNSEAMISIDPIAVAALIEDLVEAHECRINAKSLATVRTWDTDITAIRSQLRDAGIMVEE